jgi:diguanylate cyclase (GGDEF)-like protein
LAGNIARIGCACGLSIASSPRALFKVLVAIILVVVAIAIYLTVSTTGQLAATAQNASDEAELAQLAAEASDRLRALDQIVQRRIQTALQSPEVTSLTEGQQAEAADWLTGRTFAPPKSVLATVTAPFPLDDAVEFQAAVDYLRGRVDLLLANIEGEIFQTLALQFKTSFDQTIENYYQEPTLEHLRALNVSVAGFRSYTATQVPALSSEAVTLRDDLDSSIYFLRWTILATALIGGSVVLIFGFYMSRTSQLLLEAARAERQELSTLTQDLEYRNNQLSALYNVFNEITDTLSLRYVVKATMFESLRIMKADMVVLRILRGSDLEVAGAMMADQQNVEGLAAVPLGEGPTGRTAKRGRTLRIDEGGERLMAPPDAADDDSGAPSRQGGFAEYLESGLIVPLIVGARVVGTISCWSREKNAFGAGDERVMEMMASQVATAIVAADTTEKSEVRAMHDPLTALPNRRQLDEDVAGRLRELVQRDGTAVFAMIDIDHFKRFNDDYGHRVGDVTLQKVAAVMRSSARDNDLVYRYGGEEFLVVFTDTRPGDALALAERLRLAVEAAPLSGENLDPIGPVTISIGLSLLPDHGTEVAGLIELADRAMYRAKDKGRNRVEIWDGVEDSHEIPDVA